MGPARQLAAFISHGQHLSIAEQHGNSSIILPTNNRQVSHPQGLE